MSEVPQDTKLLNTHHGFLVFIGFDTSDKEWFALAEGVHEGLQGLLEL